MCLYGLEKRMCLCGFHILALFCQRDEKNDFMFFNVVYFPDKTIERVNQILVEKSTQILIWKVEKNWKNVSNFGLHNVWNRTSKKVKSKFYKKKLSIKTVVKNDETKPFFAKI